VNTTRTQNEDGFLYAREKVSDIRTGVVTPLHTGGVLDINVYTVSACLCPIWSLKLQVLIRAGDRLFGRPRSARLLVFPLGLQERYHRRWYVVRRSRLLQPKVQTNIIAGIFIKWNSLPGGTLKSNGGSLVHEVGHWLGLYHTWQDGCTTPNDEVDDTPAEDPINANRGLQTCPASFDSCPDMPGQDPIHN
jgi:hypothetical protein